MRCHRQEVEQMKKLKVLLVIMAVMMAGCIVVVPGDGYYRGYREGPYPLYGLPLPVKQNPSNAR